MPAYCSNYWWTARRCASTGTSVGQRLRRDHVRRRRRARRSGAHQRHPADRHGSPPSPTSSRVWRRPTRTASWRCTGNTATYKYCDRTRQQRRLRQPRGATGGGQVPAGQQRPVPELPGLPVHRRDPDQVQRDGTMTVWSKELEQPRSAPCGGTTRRHGRHRPVPDRPGHLRRTARRAPRPVHQRARSATACRWAPTPATLTTTYTYDINMTLADQYCGQGNVYIEGTLKGRVTVATSNSIIVTGDLVLAGGVDGTRHARSGRGELGRGLPPHAGHLRVQTWTT